MYWLGCFRHWGGDYRQCWEGSFAPSDYCLDGMSLYPGYNRNACCVARSQWFWTDESAVGFMNWDPFEPRAEPCSVLVWNSETFVWSDASSCRSNKNYVCKRRVLESVEQTPDPQINGKILCELLSRVVKLINSRGCALYVAYSNILLFGDFNALIFSEYIKLLYFFSVASVRIFRIFRVF